MKLPRWVHHLYAKVFGYFWLPCPLCGETFGGHEWLVDSFRLGADGQNVRASSIPSPGRPGRSTGICPACTVAGKGYELPRRRYVS